MADDQGTDQASSSSTTKYHQVAVPDHPLTSPTSGNTFVRMGSFPATADPAAPPASYQKSLALAGPTAGALLAAGGHWSHSDGHRITTTVGHVVDIIQGSYIAHRSCAASPPGPALSCTWASSTYSQVGSEDYPVGSGGSLSGDPTSNSASNYNVAYATAFLTGSSATAVGSNSPAATNATVDSNLPSNGDVVSATWAHRVLSYVGSAAKIVPWVSTRTFAGVYTYDVIAAAITNTLAASAIANITQGVAIENNTAGLVIGNTTEALAIGNATAALAILNVTRAAISVTSFNTVPLTTTTNTGASITNNVGAITTNNAGVCSTTTLGDVNTTTTGAVNTTTVGDVSNKTVGLTTTLTIGDSTTFNTGDTMTTTTGAGTTFNMGDSTTQTFGLSTSINEGESVSLNFGQVTSFTASTYEMSGVEAAYMFVSINLGL